MGEVYRARDTRLGRDVALKVLAARFSARPELGAPGGAPRQTTGFTLAFRSTAQGHPMMVGVASPIRRAPGAGDDVVGVLLATLLLPTLNEWLSVAESRNGDQDCPHRFTVLLNRRQVVRHPCLESGWSLPIPPEDYYARDPVQALLQASDSVSSAHADPLRQSETHLAAVSRLEMNPDWVVIVQQSSARALEPLSGLTKGFRGFGWMGAAMGLLGLAIVSLLLVRSFREASPSDRVPVTGDPESR